MYTEILLWPERAALLSACANPMVHLRRLFLYVCVVLIKTTTAAIVRTTTTTKTTTTTHNGSEEKSSDGSNRHYPDLQ